MVNQRGQIVRLAAATWFGMDSTMWVPAGLDLQPYTKIMDETKALGYNTIRLTYSNQGVESNPIIRAHVRANPELKGLHSLQVMDRIVSYAHKIGLSVILDDQRSVATQWRHPSHKLDATWSHVGYPEYKWVGDWKFLARRYLHNDAVIGFDLRNEPHTAHGPWNLYKYESEGSTWGPSCGIENPAGDWRLAAERAGNAALSVNPKLLMFVEGVQLYPEGCSGKVDSYWWGGILTGVAHYPVEFKVPHQLVYSPHEYGPIKWPYTWFPHMTYASMLKVWNYRWGFILKHPHAPYAAPIFIGEFGTCTRKPKCVNAQADGNQATWLHIMVEFLQKHPSVGWGIWALNGTNLVGERAGNGVLNRTWNGPQNLDLQRLLDTVEH